MVVDFLIWDSCQKKIFLQKRAPTRKLYPNRWEIPGGHQEPGESPKDTISRELFEELGCELVDVGPLLHTYLWQDAKTRNDVYVITMRGTPTLEAGKVTDICWCTIEEAITLFSAQEESDGALAAIEALKDWVGQEKEACGEAAVSESR